jgi:hypothetical protein
MFIGCCALVGCSQTFFPEKVKIRMNANFNLTLQLDCENVITDELMPNIYGIPLRISTDEAVYFPSGHNLRLFIYDNETLNWKNLDNGLPEPFPGNEGDVVTRESL